MLSQKSSWHVYGRMCSADNVIVALLQLICVLRWFRVMVKWNSQGSSVILGSQKNNVMRRKSILWFLKINFCFRRGGNL